MFASDYRKVFSSNHPFESDNLALSEFPANYARLSLPCSSRSSSRISIERSNVMEFCSEGTAHAHPELKHFGIY